MNRDKSVSVLGPCQLENMLGTFESGGCDRDKIYLSVGTCGPGLRLHSPVLLRAHHSTITL